MSLTSEKVANAMAKGVGFVCANCTKYWQGTADGGDKCEAAKQGTECGGPLMGLGFPEYEGPLAGYVMNFCFVCGDKSRYGARGKCGNLVGVCGEHTDVIKSFSRPSERPSFVTGKSLKILE